jgi:hypothetical protein
MQGMSDKQELIVTPDGFPDYFRGWMIANDLQTVQECADRLGVISKLVYLLLRGDRTPSKDILEKVGLETVYRAKRPSGKR